MVRTKEHIYGLPDLPPKHATAVRLGNMQVNFTCRVIQVCRAAGIPVYLENPGSSRMFHFPRLVRLLDSALVVNSDYCQFNTPWRKITKVAAWNSCVLDALDKQCSGRNGICSRSGKHHIVLQGKPPGGSKCWTLIAEPYPRSWAKAAANIMIQSMQHLTENRLFVLGFLGEAGSGPKQTTAT